MPVGKVDLRLDENILKDLIFLAQNVGKVQEILRLAGDGPPSADVQRSIKHVAAGTGLPEDNVERLLHTIYNITRTMARMRIDAAQFLLGATESLEEEKYEDISHEDIEAWSAAVEPLRQALPMVSPDIPFAVARKADRLARSQQNITYEMKIITDLRPVFSQAGDKILRSVLTHRLLVDYFDGGRVARVEFGLDDADITDLRKACERAELKAITLKKSLRGIPWGEEVAE